MPRVRPRSNIYALMPILATLIMAAGIAVTWMRIAEYTGPIQAKPLPPAPIREHPEPAVVPKETAPAKTEEPVLEPGKEKGTEGAAPAEGVEAAPKEAAPGVEEKAPAVKEKAPAEVPKAVEGKKEGKGPVEEEEK